MIPVMIVFAAALAGICALVFFLVTMVSKSGKKKGFAPDKTKEDEWAKLAASHDVEKGYEQRITDTESYDTVKEICGKVRNAVTAGLVTPIRVAVPEEVRAFDPAGYAKSAFDRDEILQVCGAAEERIAVWKKYRDEIDLACVTASDSPDARCREECFKKIENLYELLRPDMAFKVSCPGGNGKTYSTVKYLPYRELAGICGKTPVPAPDMRARYERLKKAGFRCERCGKSPLTGGILRIAGDEVLCQDCGQRETKGEAV